MDETEQHRDRGLQGCLHADSGGYCAMNTDLAGNDMLGAPFETPPGYARIVARIAGTGVEGDLTEFETVIDGFVFGLQTVAYPAASFGDIIYTDFVYVVQRAHPTRVDIHFHDNGFSGIVDRNLYVDYIEVNGARLESEVDGNYRISVKSVEVGPTEVMDKNGTLSFTELPLAGWSQVALTVAGTGTSTKPPKYEVFFDGISAGVFSINNPTDNNAPLVYEEVVFDLENRPETVGIAFMNNKTIEGVDRNLYVDKIIVDNITYEAELDGFYVRNNGKVIGPTSQMLWNGKMSFDTDIPEVTTLLLRMAGLGAPDAPPVFDVRVDGVSLGIQTITKPMPTSKEKVFEYFDFDIPGPPPDLVEIEFLNTGVSGDIGTTLYIDYIDVDDTRYESELDSVYVRSSGTVVGASGDMYWYGTCSFEIDA